MEKLHIVRNEGRLTGGQIKRSHSLDRRNGVMMKLGRRIVAGAMAGVLAVSLWLVDADTIRAEEMLPSGIEGAVVTDGAEGVQEGETDGNLEDGVADVPEGSADSEPEDKGADVPGDEVSGEAEGEVAGEPEGGIALEDGAEGGSEAGGTGAADQEESLAEPSEEEEGVKTAEKTDGKPETTAEAQEVIQETETVGQAADIASGVDWTFNAGGKLTIWSDAGMSDWWNVGRKDYKEEVVSVEVQAGVTEVWGFSDYGSLTSITIPSGVTSIGNSAFSGCGSLVSITIPSGVESIGSRAFNSCSSLESVTMQGTIPPTLAVEDKDIGKTYVFDSCKFVTDNAQGIKIPLGTVESYKTAWAEWADYITGDSKSADGFLVSGTDWMLDVDGKLTIRSDKGMEGWQNIGKINHARQVVSVEIAAGVTCIPGSSFAECENLKQILIPSGVKNIGNRAFFGCSLTSITIPSSVTSIGNQAFSGCTRLTSITIPSGVAGIGELAFSGCGSLTGIILPSGVTSIEDGVFYNCSSLTSITIPSGVMGIGAYAFRGCSSLERVIMQGTTPPALGVTKDDADVTHVFQFCKFVKDKTQGIEVPVGTVEEYKTAWTELADYIADGGPIASGTDWTLDADGKLTIRSDTGMEDWLNVGKSNHEKQIVNVEIQDRVTSIPGNSFKRCNSLTSIMFSSGVTSIGEWAFGWCGNLTSVTLPSGVTSIGEWAFYGCSSLTSITLPSDLTNIEDATFSGCSSLTGITFPSGVKSIGESAFLGCSSLTDITLPSGLKSIGDNAFNSCSSLTDIMLPPMVTSIGERVFWDCDSLRGIEIPSSVTSIGEWAFYSCNSLQSITIPFDVTSIGSNAFKSCDSLESVSMKGIMPPTLGVTNEGTEKTYVFSNCKFVTDNAKGIQVPSGTVAAYKAAWPEWAAYIADDREKVEAAKQAAETALTEIQVSNATTQESLEAAMKDAVKAALEEAGIGSDGVVITVEDFIRKGATIKAEGSVSGSIRITSGTESVVIPVNKTIDKLPVTPAGKVAAAKAAVEDAVKNAIDRLLAGTGVTNENAEEAAAEIAELIPDAVAGALVEAGVSADEVAAGEAGIEVQLADADSGGSINITIPLTSKEDAGQSDCAAVWVQIAKPGGETEPDKDAQKMVEDALKVITVTNETTKEDLLGALRKELDGKAMVEGIEKFHKVDATEGAPGSISLSIKAVVNGKTVTVDTTVTIKRLGRKTGVYILFTDYYDMDGATPRYKYTGTAVKPAVKVYHNGTLLASGIDYSVSYKNNTKVGTAASLTVKGKGNFSGTSNVVNFTIINADIEQDTAHPKEMTIIVNTKVVPVIMNGTKKLTDKDYQLEGEGLVNGKYAAATAEGKPNILTVKGAGSYAGSSFEIKVRVIEKSVAKKLAVAVDRNFKPVYTGSPLDLSGLIKKAQGGGGAITVTDKKDRTKILEEGTDFAVVCTSDLSSAGTVKFTVTGMGEYTGSVNKSFRINPLKGTDSNRFSVTFDEGKAYEYNASGTAVDNLVVKYLGETNSAEDDRILIKGVDYKVTYSNHKKVSGTRNARLKVTFLGNYKGSSAVSREFKVVTAKLSAENTVVTVPDKVYTKGNRAYKSTPIVTVDGAAIKASHYTVSYAWVTGSEAGDDTKYVPDNKVKITIADGDTWAKVRVTVTPKQAGCYALAEGTVLTGEYYVRKADGATDLSKAKVTFFDKAGKQLKSLEYNGAPFYTPDGNDIKAGGDPEDQNAVYVKVTVRGAVVDPALYDVVWTNATKKGKATVVIRGKGIDTGNGIAVGSKNQPINIKAMALKGKTLEAFMEHTANVIDSLKSIF